MSSTINSALALTKTKIYQRYHVFAYKLNRDVNPNDDIAIYGSIIILASFGGNPNEGETELEADQRAKDEAVEYAQSIYKICGYPLIFYTKSHLWFNFCKRPSVDKIHYIDDKSGITFAKDFINKDLIQKLVKDEEKAIIDKERQKMIRKRNNPDNVEHYVSAIENVVRIDNDIRDLEKQIEDRKKDLLFETEKLKRHYLNHQKHEKEAMMLLRTRMKPVDYSFLMLNYRRIRKEIFDGESKGESKEESKGESKGESIEGEEFSFYTKKKKSSSETDFWPSSKLCSENSEKSEKWIRKTSKSIESEKMKEASEANEKESEASEKESEASEVNEKE